MMMSLCSRPLACSLAVLVASLAMLMTEAQADRVNPTDYGRWSLFYSNDYKLAVGGRHANMKGICVAETGNEESKFAFIAFLPFFNKQKGPYAATIHVQAASSKWHFAVHTGTLKVSSQSSPEFNIEVTDALFDDDMIVFSLGGYGEASPWLQAFSKVAKGDIFLKDKKGRVLARFPSEGLSEVYPKLLECGGIE